MILPLFKLFFGLYSEICVYKYLLFSHLANSVILSELNELVKNQCPAAVNELDRFAAVSVEPEVLIKGIFQGISLHLQEDFKKGDGIF